MFLEWASERSNEPDIERFGGALIGNS